MWGVRVNESGDDHDLYTKTNALAHKLDDSRQTGGVRYRYRSERLEDVFTMNDFGWPLRAPNHPLYLNTEFGHMFPTKRFDLGDRLREHTHRHARVHDALAADVKYAGGSAGVRSITTRTNISAPATASATTAFPTFSAFKTGSRIL